ncbi:hypothetical protein C2E23DRAFT_314290 [Lenzites betulinus]|nr:hypothetical protein C2E23DRAFT_314290 [Lenzites betulinus]
MLSTVVIVSWERPTGPTNTQSTVPIPGCQCSSSKDDFIKTTLPMRFHAQALPLLLVAFTTSTNAMVTSLTMHSRQTDECPSALCAGLGSHCSDTCICVDPFANGRGACVPESCVSAPCATNADCCSTPLPFVCLQPPEGLNVSAMCAPTLPPSETGS